MAKQYGCGTLAVVAFGALVVGSALSKCGGRTNTHSTPSSNSFTTSRNSSASSNTLQPFSGARSSGGASSIPTPSTKTPGRSQNSFRPTTVTLTKDVKAVKSVGAGRSEFVVIPSGSKVTLRVISRDKVLIELDGATQEISAMDTDLLEQMIEASFN